MAMNVLREGHPEGVGIDPERVERVYGLLEGWVKEDKIPGAAICVARDGVIVAHKAFGKMGTKADSPPADKDTIWLVASVTKPITCCGFMLLVERGKITLDDMVADFVPEFGQKGKGSVRIRHLLTHTSGLPDMLPNNTELREQRAPLKKFVEHVCGCELLFPPGTNISYQSMGIAMLAEIVERIENIPFREFLWQEIFEPLGMKDTWLGLGSLPRSRIAECHITDEEAKIWHWNTDYWRDFGAPWGGLHSTVGDMAVFLQMMLNKGSYGNRHILSPATVEVMTKCQTDEMPDIPTEVKGKQRWGLGWWLKPLGESLPFGDLVSDETYGHVGATGTVVWVDAQRNLICCLFTNEPYDRSKRLLALASNAAVATVIG